MNINSNRVQDLRDGYRLHSFEIWNWGTFDDQIWRIEVNGETSLLTGANASGKTTLVDGLLTLLVPERRMRFYNQTAGAKGERSEESYLTGEYAEIDNHKTQTIDVKCLRPDKAKTQSLLLAVFKNGADVVTLAQARWYANEELKRTFIFSRKQLSIEADFSPFDSHGEWKKRLRSKYTSNEDKEELILTVSPRAYGQVMREAFGMRSVKAHTLFSQTVGLKVLGSLDDFIRRQMLEPSGVEGEYQQLKAHFNTLNEAHLAIEKVACQIELLKPVCEQANELESLKENLAYQEKLLSVLPLWFAKKEITQLKQAIVDLQKDQKAKSSEIDHLKEEKKVLDDRERDLDIKISSAQDEKRITVLEQQLQTKLSEQQERQMDYQKYIDVLELLSFDSSLSDREHFSMHQQRAKDLKSQLLASLNGLEERKLLLQQKRQDAEQNLKDWTSQHQQLDGTSHNITGAVARIRQEIADSLKIDVQELPFAGELMKVQEEYGEWEYAINKVLYHFAHHILVDAEYYDAVNAYVNGNDLRGRIVYHKLPVDMARINDAVQLSDNNLVAKLEFKDSRYQQWLLNEVIRGYDYECVDSLSEFKHSSKALMKSGLIKNRSRHEKDDRKHVKEKRNFVLGWDNSEKLQEIEAKIADYEMQINTLEHEITQLRNERETAEKQLEGATRLMEYSGYSRFDLSEISSEIRAISEQIDRVKEIIEQNPQLKSEYQLIVEKLEACSEQLEGLQGELHLIDSKIAEKEIKLSDLEAEINQVTNEESLALLKQFEQSEYMPKKSRHKTLDSLRKHIVKAIEEDTESTKEAIRNKSSAIEGLMRSFIYPNPDILSRFKDWPSDVQELSDDITHLEAYEQMLRRLEEYKLVEYRDRFKLFLSEEMIIRMADFQVGLLQQEEGIESSIQALNQSLRKINFQNHPQTFISLQTVKDDTDKIKSFKKLLNKWKPGLKAIGESYDEKTLEESYLSIKNFLDELAKDDSYRKYVLDVRNWIRFKAVEYLRTTPSKVQRTYTGTAKLSGGEGAQLTYTILGSAIAYQFGIHNSGENHHSFRFICVDEAFSKQDDERARFLMDLCQQLNLQLMVVSPAKAEEVAIVEPYISRVHFVQRHKNRESRIMDLSIKSLLS